jgi:hypothetical protein
MTEKTDANASKKKQFFLVKIVVFLALIFFGYFGFKYWQISVEKKSQAKSQIEKFDNVESEIFDLADEYKNHSGADDLSDMTMNELKEKGAEFVYQMLLKNQVQIEDLRSQIQELKSEILKYKNQEKIGKMIFTYVDLRQNIFSGKSGEEELKTFELLISSDEILQNKITKLKSLLANFSNQEKLIAAFSDLIPELVIAKDNNPNPGIVAKIRRNLSKLIIVRRIDGENPNNIDGIIVKIEKSLQAENYQEAFNQALSLDQNYHKILKEFLDSLSVAVEVQKIDQEILNYLKTLS